MAVSLDALPPYLSNRNHPNMAFVPPVLFFGFEISGNNQYWEAIYPNLGGVTQQIVYGLDGNTVEIAVIGNNVEPFPPCTQEGIDKTIKALGHPPKVYVSIEYPWWGRRLHYNYSCELWHPSSGLILTVSFRVNPVLPAVSSSPLEVDPMKG